MAKRRTKKSPIRTNVDRAERAVEAMKVATDWDGDLSAVEVETYAGDMIANLHHLCQQRGVNWDEVLRRGDNHYTAEREGSDFDGGEIGCQNEPGRKFIDANGNLYPADMPYYQPWIQDGLMVDASGKTWEKNAVWVKKSACSKLFPKWDIMEYSGQHIPKPLFVDFTGLNPAATVKCPCCDYQDNPETFPVTDGKHHCPNCDNDGSRDEDVITASEWEALFIPARLEYLRGELRAEQISMGELAELQDLAAHIQPGDVELLEAAGVPEFPEHEVIQPQS